jgi:AraC-like DNA-binding protein
MNQALLDRFKDYVNTHYSDNSLTAKAICSYLHCSVSCLRNTLFSIYGYPIKRYLEYFRILKAIELICKGEKKVDGMVGYKSAPAFSRAFKKVTKFNVRSLVICKGINHRNIVKTILNTKIESPKKVIENITKYVLKKIHASKKTKTTTKYQKW